MDEAARYEYEERSRAELRSEWRPIVDAVLAQVKHQLGDETETQVDEDCPGAWYYGAGWVLMQPEGKTTADQSKWDGAARNRRYNPVKLTIEGIRVPVMCWSDGRACVRFDPANIALEDDDDYASLWLGGDAMSDWDILNGNDNLLVAIAAAADKEPEYLEKARRAQQINDERAILAATVQTEPEPTKPDTDSLEAADEILRRFADDLFCVPKFAGGRTGIDLNDDDLKDNRAFLIAGQIYALARELRGLRDDMEAKRYA